MLQIIIDGAELYDDAKEEFYSIEKTILNLEHSLVSIYAWESKYHKPFFETMEKGLSTGETLDYIKFMTLNENVPDTVYFFLTKDQIEKVTAYIDNPMTATKFNDYRKGNEKVGGKKEIITAEIIYYWMVSLGIPFECENWHINRLITLIRVCSIKNSSGSPGSKMNKKETMAFNRALMASRRNKGGH